MDSRWLAGFAAALVAGCATAPPPPQPEVVVYTRPPNDPRYQIPQQYRDIARLDPAQRLANARFQQEAQVVHERVMHDPAFGGFILRWLPEPHAVVMFTGDAEARLRRYTADPRFRAQRVELTLAQLERMKDAFGDQLSRLGLACFTVDGDEEHNSVTVGAPGAELAKIRAAIASGKIKPPPKLRLKEEGCATWR